MVNKEITFIQVSSVDRHRIDEIYEMLRICGLDMYEKQGLCHWKTPYPLERIHQDCGQRLVFVASQADQTVGTFQIELKEDAAWIYKLAVHPDYAGHGLGTLMLQEATIIALKQRYSKLKCDVYDQSKGAISFYQRNGFEIIGSMPTKHFRVVLMERKIEANIDMG